MTTVDNPAAVKLADDAIALFWPIATSDNPAISSYTSEPYKHARALVLAAFAVAFPDLDPSAVEDVWLDCNEGAAWCARVVRESLAAEADALAILSEDDRRFAAMIERQAAAGKCGATNGLGDEFTGDAVCVLPAGHDGPHDDDPLCPNSTWDGNRDDPTYYFCGLPRLHAGECGAWRA